MRVLPILFNTEMVRAILDGRKTVTRRVVKEIPVETHRIEENVFPDGHKDFEYHWGVFRADVHGFLDFANIVVPPYQPGDILYVRETWQECEWGYLYRAWPKGLHQPGTYKGMPWRPSIYMPKEAARIWLKVTDVKVKRLQEIDNVHILAEGANQCAVSHYIKQMSEESDEWVHVAYTVEFQQLWNSTIKKADFDRYGWDANPWVWVIKFERCEKPNENESARSSEWREK